jgi:hypothetical protein
MLPGLVQQIEKVAQASDSGGFLGVPEALEQDLPNRPGESGLRVSRWG